MRNCFPSLTSVSSLQFHNMCFEEPHIEPTEVHDLCSVVFKSLINLRDLFLHVESLVVIIFAITFNFPISVFKIGNANMMEKSNLPNSFGECLRVVNINVKAIFFF